MSPRGVYQRSRKPMRDRFWLKVDRRGEDECWPWTGGTNGVGYGQFMVASHKGVDDIVGAHRMALFLATGVWPSEDTRHLCHNPICCNPHHLTPGTRAENMRDMVAAGRSLVGELQPNHKLTWNEVREARQQHEEGASPSHLAQRFAVSDRTMRQCLSKETWVDTKSDKDGPGV